MKKLKKEFNLIEKILNGKSKVKKLKPKVNNTH